MLILYILLAVLFIVIIYVISAYNGLVSKKIKMQEGWSSIDVFLKKRNDLIPNLTETVKGYASHEKETLENVTNARNLVRDANTVGDYSKAEAALKDSMVNLFAISENYPELKANENFMKIQNELSALEEEIEMSRRYYNSTVTDNNLAIESFPSNIIANMFNFKNGEFFEIADAKEREVAKVSF